MAAMNDHAFRLVYTILNIHIKRDESLTSGALVVGLVEQTLHLYRNSSKYDGETIDKLITNFGQVLKRLDPHVLIGFYERAIKCESSRRASSLPWLDQLLSLIAKNQLVPSTAVLIETVKVWMKPNHELVSLVDSLYSNEINSKLPMKFNKKISSVDHSYSVFLSGRIIKVFQDIVDPFFQSKAVDWDYLLDLDLLIPISSCITLLLDYNLKMDAKSVLNRQNLVLLNSQILFLSDQSDIDIFAAWDYIKESEGERFGSMAFNMGSSLAKRINHETAVLFFKRSRHYFDQLYKKDPSTRVTRILKPVQGECQCLLVLQMYKVSTQTNRRNA